MPWGGKITPPPGTATDDLGPGAKCLTDTRCSQARVWQPALASVCAMVGAGMARHRASSATYTHGDAIAARRPPTSSPGAMRTDTSSAACSGGFRRAPPCFEPNDSANETKPRRSATTPARNERFGGDAQAATAGSVAYGTAQMRQRPRHHPRHRDPLGRRGSALSRGGDHAAAGATSRKRPHPAVWRPSTGSVGLAADGPLAQLPRWAPPDHGSARGRGTLLAWRPAPC